ncbi:NUA3 [Candida pseudojiufengensis]|uniref:NUA3 n=1 Tax=Candida pseudojiufengensis TaxID=497109 RepID=UPI0022257691|nr:NUA3 [Candida pseudojiufengensis]KAI5965931.1 NUA3 [Candida pseudojiufengensis]
MKRKIEEEPVTDNKKLDIKFTKEDIHSFFNDQIWEPDFQNLKQEEVANSSPYKWGTIKDLINDKLLRDVRKEVLSSIAFTKKETDIYKVYQSGDLANLSGLDWEDLSKLPSLYKLRAAIYSQEFRDVISKITGSGKLSGIKTDMSINTYTKGCHLLTHDDVIGSRRVSFILYLPEPDKVWKPQYGGALRLFPAIVPNVPQTDYECKLVPQFNQIAFFTVQPGLSFHDVEEVREDKHRLSIQGWFHIPQPGEDGFVEGEQAKTEALSTLQQLQSKELQDFDFPKNIRDEINPLELKNIEFEETTEEELNYLRKFLNPKYLENDVVNKLSEFFINSSLLELKNILNEKIATSLRQLLRKSEINSQPPQKSTAVKHPWKIAIPPHKQRYMYIDGKSHHTLTKESINFVNKIGPQEQPNFNLLSPKSSKDTELIEIAKFLKSIAFKKWLKRITHLIPTTEQILVRRFRPGHDFILATTIDSEIARNDQEENVLLEATLDLTPTAIKPQSWESGEFGGYELCMEQPAEDLEDDDPAIYKSNKDSEDDSVLYTNQCKWNSLTLIVRDPSVLKFVKYVSINAKGSKWDISCQWNVKSSEEENDEENDEEEKNES